MKYITSDKAPAAIGPYSQAIELENMVFCSGQIGLDPVTGSLVEGLENQAHQAIKNVEQVLKAASTNLEKVVKTTLFLTDMADFAKINEIYGSYFKEHKPARSTVAVAALPKGALFEIEVIAMK